MIGVIHRHSANLHLSVGVSPRPRGRRDPPLRAQDFSGAAGLTVRQAQHGFAGRLGFEGRDWSYPFDRRICD